MVLLKKCYICGENLSCLGRQMVCKQGSYKCKVADIHSVCASLLTLTHLHIFLTQMDNLINNAITEILENRKDLLKVVVRQKNKFEGWLKFELAHYLEKAGMESVEVETKLEHRRDRFDLSFFHNDNFYRVELKTPNTNWKIEGVKQCGRPITKNIQSIINDAKKLNSNQGIVAFVLFPLPINDSRWMAYIDRISEKCEIKIDREKHCKIIHLTINEKNDCNLLVCSFKSRQFTNIF